MGLAEADRLGAVLRLLLKDAGCSSSAARMSALFGADDLALKQLGKLDWSGEIARAIAFTARTSAPGNRRCPRGPLAGALPSSLAEASRIDRDPLRARGRIVTMLGFPPAAADAVRSLDEHWDGAGSHSGIAARRSRCSGGSPASRRRWRSSWPATGLAGARDGARRRGRWFDPRLAERVPRRSATTTGCGTSLATRRAGRADLGAARASCSPATQRLDRVAEAFARVDRREVAVHRPPFRGRRALRRGHRCGSSSARAALRDLRRAGLLHDIGKLGVSNSILDKPGRLTEDEYAQFASTRATARRSC